MRLATVLTRATQSTRQCHSFRSSKSKTLFRTVVWIGFFAQKYAQKYFPWPELTQYNSLTSHRPRHLGPDSLGGVVGRCQGAIADPWHACFHTFSSRSKFKKSVGQRDMQEITTWRGSTLGKSARAPGARSDPPKHLAECAIFWHFWAF